MTDWLVTSTSWLVTSLPDKIVANDIINFLLYFLYF